MVDRAIRLRSTYHLAIKFLVGDYKEGYYIGVEVPAADPKSEKQFYGQNVWPGAGNSLTRLFHRHWTKP